jgi:hypothetical protein
MEWFEGKLYLTEGRRMDVLYFLRERLAFARTFSADSMKCFRETQRRISEGEHPFDQPPESFDPDHGEPPFLNEYQQAEDSIDFLGQAALSFVSGSLTLFLNEFRTELSRTQRAPKYDEKIARSNGELAAHIQWFKELGVDLIASGCDLGLIEQIVLTRNSIQHPKSIGFLTIQPTAKQKARFTRPFFLHPTEEAILEEYRAQGNEDAYQPWMMQVTQEQLLRAIDEVEKLAIWIEGQFFPRRASDVE